MPPQGVDVFREGATSDDHDMPVRLPTGAECECRAEGCGLFFTSETAFGKHRLSQPSDTYEPIRNVARDRVAENNPSAVTRWPKSTWRQCEHREGHWRISGALAHRGRSSREE